MARNGVWELQNVLLRYCRTGGSSRGVREFVENGLVAFAEKNPQIQFKTYLRRGHPLVKGSYITGYERDQTIKNLSAEEVRDVLQEMRDTLGRKVPRHSQIANRVVEQKKISVQGVWRNSRDLDPDLPAVVNRLKELQRDYGLHDLVNEMGITGIVQATQMIIRRKDAERQAAMAAAFPRRKRVAPSE